MRRIRGIWHTLCDVDGVEQLQRMLAQDQSIIEMTNQDRASSTARAILMRLFDFGGK